MVNYYANSTEVLGDNYSIISLECDEYNPNIDGTVTLTVTAKSVYGNPIEDMEIPVTCSDGNFTELNGSSITAASTVTGTTGLDGKSVQAFVYSDLQREPSDETEEIPVGPEGQFSIDVKLNSGSRFIKVVAKDKAKNSAEYVIKVQPSKALPIILMVAGAILMAVSLFIFFGTQKQIRQLEESNRAKTATVQEKKKR